MLLAAILFFMGAFNAIVVTAEKNVQVKGDTSYFLPDNAILPENYKIIIDITDSFVNIDKREFNGFLEITALVNADNIEEITLHAAEIQITGKIKVEDSEGVQYYTSHQNDTTREFLIIKLNQTIIKGKRIKITVESYTGKLQNNMIGVYVSQYKENEDKDLKSVLTTQFQPTNARKAFPCFDEPKYKAKFQLTIKKQPKYKVISNMPSNQQNYGSGATLVTFPETPKMSTYLLAFIVHEFESRSSPDYPNYNIWSRLEAINQTKWATDYVFKIVDDLNRFTGINYEQYINKMDLAALPDFSAGAMENWGLITFREKALLVDNDLSTNEDIQRVLKVISHEVAHQWFGDLITFQWWNNTWLNEGFATYFEYHTTGNVRPDWEMKDQFVVEQQQTVFETDALPSSSSLTLSVYTPSEIISHFGSISYGKGGSVIRMMEHFLGSDIFKKALQHYLNVNRLKNTEPEDLLFAFQYVIDENNVNLEYPIKDIMENWISQGGYPVVSLKYDSGYVTFSQQRFLSHPSKESSNKHSNWFVPISYTTSNDSDYTNLKPKFWLTPNEPIKTIAIGDDIDYLIANIQEAGYYRVNYDDFLWQKLAEVLHERGTIIHYMNKAQIVDDVMNLARAGLVDYKIAFNITDYLATETNYYPWYSAFRAFRYLLQRYSDTEDTGYVLRMYLRDLTKHLVEDKDFVDAMETQVEVLNRVAALDWACRLGNKKCIDQAKVLFQAFKTEDKTIPRNLRSIVYCTGLLNGNKEDWNFLWNKFEKSNSAAEKIGIINALGCSNDENILKQFLQKSIDPNSIIRKQDRAFVFHAVYSGSSKGVDMAFNFLINNHAAIIDNYNGMNDLEKIVFGIGSRLTDSDQIEEFKELLESGSNFDHFQGKAIAIVEQNVAWAEKYRHIIGNILNNKKNSAVGMFSNKHVAFVSIGVVFIMYLVLI